MKHIQYIYKTSILLMLVALVTFSCTKKSAPNKKNKKAKKGQIEIPVDKNKIRATIIKNLQYNTDGSYSSYFLDTITGTKCVLKFPANCFELAKKEGYTIQDVVDSCQNRVFTVMYRMMRELKCTEIQFSSLWRPYTPGNPNSPHNTGRGMDITRMKSKYGDTYFSINAGGTESAYTKLIRAWCYPKNIDITQYFSPWQMCNEKTNCNGACCENDHTSPNHKLHLTHLHLTVKADY